MRWWITTLWCLAAVAALAMTVTTIDGREPFGGGARRAGNRLVDRQATDPELVEEIVLSRANGPSLRWKRTGDAWIEVEPSGLPVDPFAVRELLAAADGLTPSRWVALDGEEGDRLRRSLDLDPPQASLLLRHGKGSSRLLLGRIGLAGRAFAQIVSDGTDASPTEAAVVGQELHTLLLGQDPAAWRLRTIFPDAGVETRRIEYRAGESALRLVRRGPRWWLELPVRTRADRSAVAAYLGALARVECAGFLGPAEAPDVLADHGLAPALGSIAVTSGEGSAASTRELLIGRTLAIGGQDRFGMLVGHPVLLALGPTTLQSLFAAPASLIDPTACDVLPADVKQVRITGPEGPFSIERDLDQWRLREASGADGTFVGSRPMEEFFRRLTEARATSVNLRDLPRELLIGQIELIGFDGGLLAQIEVGADPQGTQVALDAGDGVARIFPGSLAPSLTKAGFGVQPK